MMMTMMLMGLSLASAQPIPLSFSADAHVYTWPQAWAPAGMGPESLETIAQDIAGRHYPFYVVLLDGDLLPGVGDGQARLQATTDALLSSWGEQGLDLGHYVVFSVAWGADCHLPPDARRPGTVCQYFLNAGSALIHGPAQFLPSRDHEAHTRLFRRAVATTPQDPEAGILAVIASVDELLWSRTSPETLLLTARQGLQQARMYRETLLPIASAPDQARYTPEIALAQQALEQGRLDEISRLGETMTQDNQTLAAHTEQYQTARRTLDVLVLQIRRAAAAGLLEDTDHRAHLDAARAALEQRDPDAIQRSTADLERLHDTAEARAAVLRRTTRRRLIAALGGMVWVSLLALGGLVWRGWRREAAQEARFRYAMRRDVIAEKVDRAVARYTALALDDREVFAALADTDGETRRESLAVSAALDHIYTGLRALERHVQALDAKVEAAGRLAVNPVHEATEALHAAISVPPTARTPEAMFSSAADAPQIHALPFLDALEDRVQDVLVRRARLQKAMELRFQHSWTVFGHDTLTVLLASLQQRRIPTHWVSDHPLAGDDAADARWYASLDAIRRDDPLVYLTTLEGYQAQEAAIVQRVEALEAALEALQSAHLPADALPDLSGCVLEPADDPRHTCRRAQLLEDEARHLLIVRALQRDPEPVVQKLDDARRAWEHSRSQLSEIQLAGESQETAGALVTAWMQEAHQDRDQVQRDYQGSSREFQRAGLGMEQLSSAHETLQAAARLWQRVEGLWQERRMVEALRGMRGIEGLISQARLQTRMAQGHLSRLREERETYTRQAQGMAALRAAAAEKMDAWGGDPATLAPPMLPPLTGPVDYAAQCQQLDELAEHWANQVRKAQHAHEAQRRQQEAAAEARRQHAATSRRRSVHKSSFSSASPSLGRSSRSSSRRSSGGGGSFGSKRSSGGGGGW